MRRYLTDNKYELNQLYLTIHVKILLRIELAILDIILFLSGMFRVKQT
jgi:hypothetical protein